MRNPGAGLALALLLLAAGAGSVRAELPSHLHLMASFNDNERYPVAADTSLLGALEGNVPERIQADAKAYYVQLEEGSTIETLSLPVKGEEPGGRMEAEGTQVARESAMAGAGESDQGDTGWIELDATAASVYLWSEIGEGESDWYVNQPRVLIRRFKGGKIIAAILKDGAELAADEE